MALEGLKPPPSGGDTAGRLDVLAGGVERPRLWMLPRVLCQIPGEAALPAERHGHGVPNIAKPCRIQAAAATVS